jgi:hypothetical protein
MSAMNNSCMSIFLLNYRTILTTIERHMDDAWFMTTIGVDLHFKAIFMFTKRAMYFWGLKKRDSVFTSFYMGNRSDGKPFDESLS